MMQRFWLWLANRCARRAGCIVVDDRGLTEAAIALQKLALYCETSGHLRHRYHAGRRVYRLAAAAHHDLVVARRRGLIHGDETYYADVRDLRETGSALQVRDGEDDLERSA